MSFNQHIVCKTYISILLHISSDNDDRIVSSGREGARQGYENIKHSTENGKKPASSSSTFQSSNSSPCGQCGDHRETVFSLMGIVGSYPCNVTDVGTIFYHYSDAILDSCHPCFENDLRAGVIAS